MLSFETSVCHPGLPFSNQYNVLVSQSNSNSKPDNFSREDSNYPVLSNSQRTAGVGVLRMPNYVNDTDSDLIYQEIEKLSENTKMSSDRSLPSKLHCSKLEDYENLNHITEIETSSPPKSYKKLPKNPFIKSVFENFPPQHSKITKKREREIQVSSSIPVWPSSMSTYSRGVSVYSTHPLVGPSEPSIASLRAQIRLQKIRDEIQSLKDSEMARNDREREKGDRESHSKISRTTTSYENHDHDSDVCNDIINVKNTPNSESVSKHPSPVRYYGQSPFDDDFDPSIHKPNVNQSSVFHSTKTTDNRFLLSVGAINSQDPRNDSNTASRSDQFPSIPNHRWYASTAGIPKVVDIDRLGSIGLCRGTITIKG